ncbi:MAG: hypothetical protein A3B30_01595 [Candidatus Komeilibacteria bacterium RIFCSPLOWO2_01_FULL_52_15]|uniref:Uncharacterized protein n=2 Tax=Candidatus Komeiliibacteriota TaxID=1817908 RepID=A0A1G2BU14_9BACT|nr:MAG: hypothetical protein A2677_01120 [Candidatus Komeilibacteria bacterium RIFCSPHIGHO2_01_FULL_52_14]OGY91737.1 MAG: hypothetical protein A3B30_01595 [Candidatus Komeilibacteria bacterium RIFCSPLOWO2_01_FULL_52_15]
MEAELDRIAKEHNITYVKDMPFIPSQPDNAFKAGKVLESYGVDLKEFVLKFATIRGEAPNTRLCLEGGILKTNRWVDGVELLLAAAHLIR